MTAITWTAEDDDSGDGLKSLATFSATQSTVYHIRVSGYSAATATGSTTLNWAPVLSPPNDNFATAQVLVGASGTVNGSTVASTSEAGEVVDGLGNSVWFIWTAPLSGTAQFDTFGSAFDTVLLVGTGNSNADIQYIARDNDATDAPPPGTSSKVRFPITLGAEYRIRIDGISAPGAFVLTDIPEAIWLKARPVKAFY